MYTLSDIYMLETSHYIQSLSDQYIIESYVCESFKDVVNNLVDKIKKMFNKVKEFFKRLFGKDSSNNDKKLKDIEKTINNNPKLRNKKIKTTDTSKFDKIVNEANKQGKKITAKQIIAAAGITTATVGAVILGIKKFKKNTPNELDKKEKEAIKKVEEIKKEEDRVVNNNNNNTTTNTEPKSVNKEDKKSNYKLTNNKYKGNGTRQKVNTTIKTNTEPKIIEKNGKYKLSTNQKYKDTRQVKGFDEQCKELLLKQSNELEKINAESKALLAVTNNIDDEIKRWEAECAHAKYELDVMVPIYTKHYHEKNKLIHSTPKAIELKNKLDEAIAKQRKAKENNTYDQKDIHYLLGGGNYYDLAVNKARKEYNEYIDNLMKKQFGECDSPPAVKTKALVNYDRLMKRKSNPNINDDDDDDLF